MDDRVVLVDTDVFSSVFMVSHDLSPTVNAWRRILLGRVVVIAAQTEAELRFGALKANWDDRRLHKLGLHISIVATVPVSDRVVLAHAELRAACFREGHPLHEKIYMGDAWVAASALGHDLPLLAGDHIYQGCPSLRVLEAPEE